MAKIKPEHAKCEQTRHGFGGIRADSTFSGEGASDMLNFRIRSDGSLEKRCGWRIWKELPSAVRGFYSGSLHQYEVCFAVCGSIVYSIDPETGSYASVNSIATSSGKVCFFLYDEELFFSDGSEIYRYDSYYSSFVVSKGYAPLIGLDWNPTAMGDYYEQPNLFNGRFRIHYSNLNGVHTFHFPFVVQSISRVTVNNHVTYAYTLADDGLSLEIPSASVGSSVEVAGTGLGGGELDTAIRSLSAFTVSGDGGTDRLFCSGAYNEYRVFVSSPVLTARLSGSKLPFPDSDKLYFTEDNILALTDRANPITALCQRYGQMLAFNRRGCWSITFPDPALDRASAVPVPGISGASSPDGVINCTGNVITVNESGIWQVRFNERYPEESAAVSISRPVNDLISSTLLGNPVTFWDPVLRELYVRDGTDAAGRVWVYSLDRELWYAFDNVAASLFFQSPIGFGFCSGKKICLFDEALDSDNGVGITASYVSNYLNFDRPDLPKRILRAVLCCNTKGADVSFFSETETVTEEIELSGSLSPAPESFDLRLSPGRFRFLRYKIETAGAFRSRFYALSLYASV